MRKDTRDRLVLPVLLPVGILVAVAAILYLFSRILLAVSKEAATATALLTAAAVVVAAVLVARPATVRASGIASMLGAVAGVAMLTGGLAFLTVGGEEEAGGGEAPATVIALAAEDIAFDQGSLAVPAGEPFRIAFHNLDVGIQHNVEIYDNPDFGGTPVFEGELVAGPAQVGYDVPALPAGTYYFICILHPNMTGEIVAGEGGGAQPGPTETGALPPAGTAAPGPGPTGVSVTVTAVGNAFDTDTIELPVETPSTITMVNEDAGVLHNVAIYTAAPGEAGSEVLFNGELAAGPVTVDYLVPALPAGTYYFLCLVHPFMNGSVIVG